MELIIYCKRRRSNDKYSPMNLSNGVYGVSLLYATKFEDLDSAKAAADKLAKKSPDFIFQVRRPGRSHPHYTTKDKPD